MTVAAWLLAAAMTALACVLVRLPTVETAFVGRSLELIGPFVRGGARGADGIQLACCAGSGQTNSMVSWELRIEPARKYLIAVTLDNYGTRDAAPVIIDLAGKDYDSMEQEFHVIVPAGNKELVARGVVPSGTPPDRVFLRVFHASPTTVVVRDVAIRAYSDAYAVLKWSALIALGIALAGLTATAQARLRHWIADRGPTSHVVTKSWLAVAVVALATAAVLNAMLGPPIVFSDEYTYYSTAAKIAGRATADIAARAQDLPNRLFLALYGLAGASLSPFALARTLNVIALGLGLGALFVAGRATNGRGTALAVAVAYGMGALSTYTAYFMPEVLYGSVYLAACVALAIALTTFGSLASAIVGMACAALTFVKPHGWVVAFVFGIFAMVHFAQVGMTERRRARLVAVVMPAAFTLCWLALRVALPDVDRRGALLGEMYGGMLGSLMKTASDVGTYASIAKNFAVEVVLVTSLVAPALIFAAWTTLQPRASVHHAWDSAACILAQTSFVTLLVLIGMTAAFTVSVAGTGSSEVINRLHWRYFSYALPLLVLGTAASKSADGFFRRNFGVVVTIWAAACIGAAVLLPLHVWSFVDSPELFFGWSAPKRMYATFGAAAVAVCLIFRRKPRVIAGAMVTAYMLDALAGGLSVRLLQLSIGDLPENRAGRFASALAEENRKPLLLLGQAKSIGLDRIASYLPLGARFVTPADFASESASRSLDGTVVVAKADTLMQAGTVPIAEFGPWAVGVVTHERRAGDIAALQPNASIALSFAKSAAGTVKAEGLYPAEDWGAWSAEPEISIALPVEVTGRVKVTVRAHVLADNVGRTIRMHIGDDMQEFVLNVTPGDVDLVFNVAKAARLVTIEGFRQRTPQEAGRKGDTRSLGIALWSMRITNLSAPNSR